jgi:hypothetical protein
MAVGSITLEQALRHPFVLNVISRITAATNPLQAHFRVGMDAPADPVMPAGIRAVSYDIFDHTRQLASLRAPEAGPKRVRRQRIGVGSGYLHRSYEAMSVTYEQIASLRPLGSPIGTLDKNGQSYVVKQIAYQTDRFRNLREWILSRMFRGGYYITLDGDDHYVSDSSGTIQVDFKHPSENRSQLAAGDAGANIIDSPWNDPSTDIVTQILNLNKAAMRRTGLPIEEIWVNSTTIGQLVNNTTLQAQGGAAFRVWETAEWKDVASISDVPQRRGLLEMRFRAIPWIVFYVCDSVLATPTTQAENHPVASTEVDLLIPNDRALMTPRPGSWLTRATGTEIIQRTLMSAPEPVVGFQTWQRPTLDPYGKELLFIDNFFPVPQIPAAWYYATVNF